MRVDYHEDGLDSIVLFLGEEPEQIVSLTEHGARDVEFVLAQRRAMSRRCTTTFGEHTCAKAPGHGKSTHLCRGCTFEWTDNKEEVAK